MRGKYKKYYYESSLELAFILFYEKSGFQIKNYDLEPILYDDNLGKVRKYYPDFIVDNKFIVEVKGFFFKNEEKIDKKRKALIEWCKDKEYSSMFVTKMNIPSNFIKEAKVLHNKKDRRRFWKEKKTTRVK